jgi:hypothetical protein
LPGRFRLRRYEGCWPRPARPASANATCRRTSWSTTPSPWRSTWGRARARCCAACWRGYAGCGVPRRSRWRVRAASRKRAAVWAKRRCAGSMRKWCALLLPAPARERGIGTGGWSAWTGPAWRWPTPRQTAPPSGGRAPAAARAPFRNSASWLWSRTARTCCSVLAWAASGRARRHWRTPRCRRCGQACCAWPTGSSSAMRSGRRPPPPAQTCCGG